jgi:hypothetical protein
MIRGEQHAAKVSGQRSHRATSASPNILSATIVHDAKACCIVASHKMTRIYNPNLALVATRGTVLNHPVPAKFGLSQIRGQHKVHMHLFWYLRIADS